ncbi:PDR/VanB family oxidoreductase [Hoyosella sp. YIM 151337]|uniref:PDR/VanB family oxidoreductase n=1 Tax=Hoyosella sp. YIM 151337 TaxID=2992742 RepID=UPI0022360AFE|nr:PDR/VanB family oxidoreductase [Hoyosella sp. YIM 151337]MCW4353698.1 PDR/VanB family oxidoreductase [Hoyosella sp. YIM 151337]
MKLLHRPPGAVPRALSRARTDRVLSAFGFAAETLWLRRVTASDYRAKRKAAPLDHVLHLQLIGRTVVAHDEDVVQLTFAAPDGSPLPLWQPGCHLDVHLPSGRRRQYSLCGDPQDNHNYRIAVRKIPDGGGGSLEMHALPLGATVELRGPKNGFPFVPRDRMLFVAGGIGITPILPMVRAAQRLGIDWQFVYCGRTLQTIPFLGEIESWDQARVMIRLDEEHGTPSAAGLLAVAPEADAVYVCGPPPMIDMLRAATVDSTVSFHAERFSAPAVRNGRPFEVQLASTGEVLAVPADASALAVIRQRQPDVAYSCQQGFCGSCKVRVLSGTPEHLDTRLTDDERSDSMLICVSRAQTARLVLDI